MQKAREFMDDFMATWNNMKKYRDVRLNPGEPNYDDFERAFSEEKKIVATDTDFRELPLEIEDVSIKTLKKKH